MSPQEMYSVEEVADLLKLHVRTVRNYVRAGRLRAKRIGKQYRIPREEVEQFVGKPVVQFDPTSVSSHDRVEVSSVIQINALSRDAANRITSVLMGAVRGRQPGDDPLRLDSMYDDERNQLKIVVFGSLPSIADLLTFVGKLVENQE